VQAEWLHKNNCEKLIIFCNGWGMDGHPFTHLSSEEFDVLMLFDYRNFQLDVDISELSNNYQTIHLIAWSMGVWVGQLLFKEYSAQLTKKIAINGTLCPIHDDFGIPGKIFTDTLSGFDERARGRFYKRMCRERSTLKTFLTRQPKRNIDEQQEELAYLSENVTCIAAVESIYSELRISDSDWVIPTVNQMNFWKGQNIMTIQGFHYPFLLWQSWEHLLEEK